jgi:putative FmdB family regulatory protein
MPIARTYQCPECFHRIEVMLEAAQWDDPPPECPACAAREMEQQFKPVAIGGSNHARAHAIAEDIIANDYHVADYQRDRHEGMRPKVRYKDQTATAMPASWGGLPGKVMQGPSLEAAAAIGRQTRLEFGSGLDVLQSNLKSGAQPDLIEVSKRRSARIW